MELEDISTIGSLVDFTKAISKEDALLVYFSHEECNVCKVLKPKIKAMLDLDFPKIKMAYTDTIKSPEIAGQERVFAVPTIVVYFGGKEYIRVSRNIGVSNLSQQIQRPYSLMFGG